MVSVTVDTSKIADFSWGFPIRVAQEICKEMKNQLEQVQLKARKVHRYTSHTSSLEKSVSFEVKDDGLSGEVGIDDSVADYGKYVHEGHGAPGKSVLNGYPYVWKPDKFLDDALEKRESEIREGIEDAVRKAIG